MKSRDIPYNGHTKEYKREWAKLKRAENLAAGMCAYCGREPFIEGLTRCQTCTDAGKVRRDKRRDRLKNSGLCNRCLCRKPDEGYSTCPTCQEANRGYIKSNLDKRQILNYKITHKEHMAIKDKCNGLCMICGSPPEGYRKVLCIDHDHSTGEVRGLLCDCCNKGLGYFKDNTDFMEKAIKYLKESGDGD